MTRLQHAVAARGFGQRPREPGLWFQETKNRRSEVICLRFCLARL